MIYGNHGCIYVRSYNPVTNELGGVLAKSSLDGKTGDHPSARMGSADAGLCTPYQLI